MTTNYCSQDDEQLSAVVENKTTSLAEHTAVSSPQKHNQSTLLSVFRIAIH